MKTATFFSFAILASTALAAPSVAIHKRQDPGPQGTITAINSWNNDVSTVNNFLNTASGLTGDALKTAAQTALTAATDEPVELGILSKINGLSQAGEEAVTLLMEVFGNVINDLQSIVDNPVGGSATQGFVDNINIVRCCNVLPSLDQLWTAAATDEGVANQVNLAVPRPNACTDNSLLIKCSD